MTLSEEKCLLPLLEMLGNDKGFSDGVREKARALRELFMTESFAIDTKERNIKALIQAIS